MLATACRLNFWPDGNILYQCVHKSCPCNPRNIKKGVEARNVHRLCSVVNNKLKKKISELNIRHPNFALTLNNHEFVLCSRKMNFWLWQNRINKQISAALYGKRFIHKYAKIKARTLNFHSFSRWRSVLLGKTGWWDCVQVPEKLVELLFSYQLVLERYLRRLLLTGAVNAESWEILRWKARPASS